MSKHYRRSPSGASRWLKCPGSLVLGADQPRKDSVYSLEGTAAHELAELLVTGQPCPPDTDSEMLAAVRVYVDFVNDLRKKHSPIVEHSELTLECEPIGGVAVEEFGGTADYHAIYREGDSLVLHIVDYKHGVGVPVSAVDNKQGLSYFVIVGSLYPDLIDKYRFSIIQPRAFAGEPEQTWECDSVKVNEHLMAVIGVEGKTELHAGEHCRWCPAIAICPELEARTREAATMEFAELTSRERVAELLRLAPAIKALLENLEEVALEHIRAGRSVPGYKAVESLSHRRWIYGDQDMTLKVLKKLGISKTLALESPKLKTPPQLEKVLSKEQKKSIESICKRFPVGYNVVPETAKGKAESFIVSEFDSVEAN